MTTQALYRKYRPQTFEEIVGQEHVTTTLKHALQEGRVAHAYLFSGPRGTGKTSAARVLAKAVNCLNEDVTARPDNSCPLCVAVNEGRSLDLIEIDAASHTGVDNIREIIERVNLMPSEGRYKIYVIDEVHMLSTSAFNALLKTLEEPPAHVIFVLATTEPHKVLPTVLSRCQRFSFRRIPAALIKEQLRYIADQEGTEVDDAALARIAQSVSGSLRDAVSLLDQLISSSSARLTVEDVNTFLGAIPTEAIGVLAEALATSDAKTSLAQISRLREQGVDMQQLAAQLVAYFRDLLLWKVGGEMALPDSDAAYRQQLSAQAQRLSGSQLSRLIRHFSTIRTDVRGGMEPQVAMELAFIEATTMGTVPVTAAAPAVSTVVPATKKATAVPSTRQATPPTTPPTTPPPRKAPQKSPKQPAPTAPLSEGDTLDHIKSNWKLVGHALRQQRMYRLQASVNSSAPVRLDAGRLFIDFQSELSYNLVVKNVHEVEQAAEQVFERHLKIVCLLQGQYKGPALVGDPLPAQPQPEKPGNVTEIANDPLVKAVLAQGGQIVSIHGKGEERPNG